MLARASRQLPAIIGAGPEVSRFLGIVIYFYYRDHAPPHFHAEYGEFEITLEIDTGIVTGKFPTRALRAVLEWYGIHKQELATGNALVKGFL